MMAVIVTSMMVIWVDGQTERCVLIEVRALSLSNPAFGVACVKSIGCHYYACETSKGCSDQSQTT